MSSQSSTDAPATRTLPLTVPDESSAKSTGWPESLMAHRTPGDRRLTATPLASGNSPSATGAAATRHDGESPRSSTVRPASMTANTTAPTTTEAFAECVLMRTVSRWAGLYGPPCINSIELRRRDQEHQPCRAHTCCSSAVHPDDVHERDGSVCF